MRGAVEAAVPARRSAAAAIQSAGTGPAAIAAGRDQAGAGRQGMKRDTGRMRMPGPTRKPCHPAACSAEGTARCSAAGTCRIRRNHRDAAVPADNPAAAVSGDPTACHPTSAVPALPDPGTSPEAVLQADQPGGLAAAGSSWLPHPHGARPRSPSQETRHRGLRCTAGAKLTPVHDCCVPEGRQKD